MKVVDEGPQLCFLFICDLPNQFHLIIIEILLVNKN